MACDVDGGKGELPGGGPRHAPRGYPLFDCVDDLGRDARVYVLFRCGILVCRHRSSNPALVFRGRARLRSVAVPFLSSVRFPSRIEHQNRGILTRKWFLIQVLFAKRPRHGCVVGRSPSGGPRGAARLWAAPRNRDWTKAPATENSFEKKQK